MTAINNFYAEDLTERATSSESWTAVEGTDGVGKIAGSNLTASTKYLIVAQGVLGGAQVNTVYGLRLSTADDATIATLSEKEVEPRFEFQNSKVGTNFFFAKSFTTDSSPADLEWQFKTADASYQCEVDQLKIWVVEWDSDFMVEAVGSGSAELSDSAWGTTDVSIASGALAASTEYLVLGYARYGMGSTNQSWYSRLRGDNVAGDALVQLDHHSAEGEDTTELRMAGHMGRVLTDAAPTVGIEINSYEEAASGNHTEEGSYLVAIDISAFEDFDYAWASSGSTVSGTPASPTTLETISSYAPTTAGNHLVVGRYDQASSAGEISGDVTVGGTPVAAGDIDTYQTQRWDATDSEHLTLMARQSITGTNDIVLRGASAASSNPVSEYEFVAVLNLELADAGLTITPALVTKSLTAVDPVITTGNVNIVPALESQPLAAIDPALSIDIKPAAVSQPVTAIDPAITTGNVNIVPALESQPLAAIDPALAIDIKPSLVSQPLAAIDPALAIDIKPAAVSQPVTAVDPVITTGNVNLEPALVTQGLAAVDPAITIGNVNLEPTLVSQPLAAVDPAITTGNVNVAPALESQLVAAVDPVVSVASVSTANVIPALARIIGGI